jgi:hypothetical protein
MTAPSTRRRARKLIVLALSPEQFDRLEAQADAAERIPEQQARWLLLRALDEETGAGSQETGAATDVDTASAAR